MQNNIPFEEEYMDVLQNIEFALVSIYKEHEKMSDYDAEKAITALIKTYQAKARGQEAAPTRLRSDQQEDAYTFVKEMCDMRLGEEISLEKDGQPVNIGISSLEIDEIIACLKRIRKSIKMWNKKWGRRGYFKFVSNYVK